MTMPSAAGTTPQASGLLDDLNQAVRENPVAAGLIGMGALWMVVGGSRISAFGGQLSSAAQSTARAAVSAGATGTRAIGSGIGSVGDSVLHAGEALSTGVSNAGARARDIASEGYDAVASSASKAFESSKGSAGANGLADRATSAGRGFSTSLQRNLSDALDKQPLLLGALGIALGAGIASIFAATEAERKLMGEQGAAVKETLESMAHDAIHTASSRVERMVEDVKQEAGDQSLTPAAVKENIGDIAEKLATVADSARQSVKDRLS